MTKLIQNQDKRQQFQCNLLYSGLVLLQSSLGYYFLHESHIGNLMRYGALISGFVLIILAGLISYGSCINAKIKLVLFAIASALIFFILSVIKGYGEFELQTFLFQVVCFFLFIAGILLYNTPLRSNPFKPKWYFWIIYAISLAGLMKFLLFVDGLTGWESGTARGFGHLEELNPIGVAYTQVSLAIVFLGAFLSCKGIFPKLAFLAGLILATGTTVITGSRGPAIFALLTTLLLIILYLRNDFSWKRLYWITGVTVLLVLIATIAILNLEFVGDRFDLLLSRLRMATQADTIYSSTGMFAGRMDIWQDYLKHSEQWFLIGMPDYTPYPHNLFVEFFARLGLYGLAVALFLVFIIIRFLFITLAYAGNVRIGDFLFIGLFFYGFLQAQTSLSLEMNRSLWIGAGYIAIFVFSRHDKLQSHSRVLNY